MSAAARRVTLAPAYILHQYPYRDTGRILEAFSADHGRVSLFARAAAGPKSTLKGILRPFQRLLVSWTGRTEACALVTAEVDGPHTSLRKEHLMSGFYLNELLLKLTQRFDPHPQIFASYAACIQALCAGGEAGEGEDHGEAAALRRFEKRLLDDLGYGLQLTTTADGAPVEPDRYYRMAAEHGPRCCVAETPGAVYGRSLSDLEAESFADARSLRDAKRVLRAAIDACLDGRPLKSREVMLALRQTRTPPQTRPPPRQTLPAPREEP